MFALNHAAVSLFCYQYLVGTLIFLERLTKFHHNSAKSTVDHLDINHPWWYLIRSEPLANLFDRKTREPKFGFVVNFAESMRLRDWDG